MCLWQALDARPDHRPGTLRALDGAAAGLNVVENVGAQDEGVGWARARCPAPWTGALGAAVRWGMRAAAGHVFARSVSGLPRPWTLCVSVSSGQFGPKGTVRGYGMSRARNAKSVLVDVFLYLIVVR